MELSLTAVKFPLTGCRAHRHISPAAPANFRMGLEPQKGLRRLFCACLSERIVVGFASEVLWWY
jgi:hypothetical protein